LSALPQPRLFTEASLHECLNLQACLYPQQYPVPPLSLQLRLQPLAPAQHHRIICRRHNSHAECSHHAKHAGYTCQCKAIEGARTASSNSHLPVTLCIRRSAVNRETRPCRQVRIASKRCCRNEEEEAGRVPDVNADAGERRNTMAADISLSVPNRWKKSHRTEKLRTTLRATRECRYIESENNRISVHLQRRVRMQLPYVRLHVRGVPKRNCGWHRQS
jgi:hypothetical protein